MFHHKEYKIHQDQCHLRLEQILDDNLCNYFAVFRHTLSMTHDKRLFQANSSQLKPGLSIQACIGIIHLLSKNFRLTGRNLHLVAQYIPHIYHGISLGKYYNPRLSSLPIIHNLLNLIQLFQHMIHTQHE